MGETVLGIHFYFIYLKSRGRETETQRARGRETMRDLHSMSLSSDACNNLGLTKPNPGVRSSVQIFLPVSGRDTTT